jgi:hypothetical protein
VRRLLLAALAVGLLPATASAALPTFTNHKIVLGKSIGGVSVGMTVKQALTRWGANPTCPPQMTDGSCDWTSAKSGSGSIYFHNGVIATVAIAMSTNNSGAPIFRGPLMRIKTSRHIGMKNTLHDVLKAYPKFHGTTLGRGSHLTNFSTSGGRIYDIFVGAQP